jgi:hypothetical protein
MTCRHCHVDAGPDRTRENMDRETVDACLAAIDQVLAAPGHALHTVDITGGAPELNPHFPYLVEACRERGLHVIDRCNLTVLLVRRYHAPPGVARRARGGGGLLAPALPRAEHGCAARGGDLREEPRSPPPPQRAGYGQGDPDRVLTLVTNPVGHSWRATRPPSSPSGSRALEREHGITFDRLFAINNMPIARYLEWLIEKGQVEPYLQRLLGAFNPGTIAGLMCRNTISVGWDGRLSTTATSTRCSSSPLAPPRTSATSIPVRGRRDAS